MNLKSNKMILKKLGLDKISNAFIQVDLNIFENSLK